jgi:hypothetical protein
MRCVSWPDVQRSSSAGRPRECRFQPVGNGKRDHNWPAKGHFGGFARLNRDFFNVIDPEQTMGSPIVPVLSPISLGKADIPPPLGRDDHCKTEQLFGRSRQAASQPRLLIPTPRFGAPPPPRPSKTMSLDPCEEGWVTLLSRYGLWTFLKSRFTSH